MDNTTKNTPPKTGFLEQMRRNRPGLYKILMSVLILFLLGGLALACFVFAILGGAYGRLPTVQELQAIQNPQATEVYGSDGGLLGKFYFQNRTNVPYEKISSNVISALVATEDARFFEHSGVDTRSLVRVLIKTLLMGDDSGGGGSTISQQLIKNLFPRENHGALSMPVNKIKENIIASRLERVYKKEAIIALYLNTVSFGEDVYGIGAAAQRFFSKDASALEPEEAAVLIGMLKATTTYNPRRNPEKSLQRRNVVLSQMAKYGRINAAKAEELKKKPLKINYNRNVVEGIALHFRERLRQDLKKWCAENPKTDGTNYNIYQDGLKIYTTIDSRMQRYAEEAVVTHLTKLQKQFDEHWKKERPWGNATDILKTAKLQSERYKSMKADGKSDMQIDIAFKTPIPMKLFSWNGEIEKTMSPLDSLAYYLMFLNTGFMAMEPQTGAVKAYVGSGDFRHFKYDHTNAKRQVGSTFKPIVYATALERGISPCDYHPNELRIYSDYQNWMPENSEADEYGGYYSMSGALSKSLNTIAAQMIFEAGIDNTIAVAQKMGINSTLPQLPAIALGTADISLQEMMQVYCALDNGGYQTPLYYLTAIKDKSGKTLAEFKSNYHKYRPVTIREETSKMITQMLKTVVDEGTARRLRTEYGLKGDIAGKTGTTQMQSDGWFIGYTPDLVAGAWVGGADRRVRFRSIALGQGANMALPIWGLFMKKVMNDNAFRSMTYKTFPALSEDTQNLLECPSFVLTYEETLPRYQDDVVSDTGESTTENPTEGDFTPANPDASVPDEMNVPNSPASRMGKVTPRTQTQARRVVAPRLKGGKNIDKEPQAQKEGEEEEGKEKQRGTGIGRFFRRVFGNDSP